MTGGLSVLPGLRMDFEESLMEEEWESLEVKQMKRSVVVEEAGRCGLSNSIG